MASTSSYYSRLYGGDEPTADETAPTDESNPVSLDGCLYCRRSGTGSLLLKRRFISLSFCNGGSLKIYNDIPSTEHQMLEMHPSSTMLRTMYSRLHRSISHQVVLKRMENLELYIPSDIPWVAKDVENDACNFVVEIAASTTTLEILDALIKEYNCFAGNREGNSLSDSDDSVVGDTSKTKKDPVDELLRELKRADKKGKPFRMHFRCSRGSHEKALWLRAFSKVGRLSTEFRKKKTFLSTITAPLQSKPQTRVRRRRESNQMFAQHTRDLDLSDCQNDPVDLTLTKDVEKLIRGSNSRYVRDKEYRVLPSYAYPHRWMTRREMHEEMMLPSETFHDLRVNNCKQKEIGSLRIEVLQCLGLPKLDRTSDTDAVVYLVCGSYAFATDVIPNRMNPIWLRKCRRACEFPIFHGYARLYVGVFDDDGRREKDDFAGRVVIDLARLRPRSTYDVTLPLRLSTHVYSRRKRGAIRLRFTLNWIAERDPLLSYIPRRLKIPLPQNTKPNFKTTVNCSDEKAFRNIAITVHGAHLPGRFTFHQMRASIRELNFTRKYIFLAIRQGFKDLRHWQNPAMSGFIFLSWMHCVYMNSFSLVPAYVVLCFVLFLMRNYVRYAVEGPWQTGFIPPSWEELFLALLKGGDADQHSIEPLELGHRPEFIARQVNAHNGIVTDQQHVAITHKPQGISLFRALGFLKKPGTQSESEKVSPHMEFPFGNDKDYPKFGTRECLVDHKGDLKSSTEVASSDDNEVLHFTDETPPERRVVPRFPLDMPQLPIDMNIPDIMRKDSSGMKEYDEEENNFTAGKAVVASGMKAAKTVRKTGKFAAYQLTSAATKTAVNLQTAATELTEMTGLNHVVMPIQKGISTSSALVTSSVNQMIAPIQKGGHLLVNQTGYLLVNQPTSGPFFRESHASKHGPMRRESVDDLTPVVRHRKSRRRAISADAYDLYHVSQSSPECSVHSLRDDGNLVRRIDLSDANSMPSTTSGFTPDDFLVEEEEEEEEEVDPALVWPQQNIDIEGPATGKKLTDDLVDIKDKVHELTWHLFDDYAYVIKRTDAVYFGEAKKPERRRKDVKKKLSKLLNVGQYSHSNPFIARMGLYVEPIIGSLYSFLCLFRAGFNILTWQDPIFTFWLSLLSGCLTIVLFVFPWRHFLFLLGFWLVGPQNWLVRILRERGHLPPLKKPVREEMPETDENLLDGQPIFSCTTGGNESQPYQAPNVDPREVHSVVVPYSPLMYQRFYDWPPEPLYAQVKPDTSEDARRRRALNALQRGARRPKRRPSLLMSTHFSRATTEEEELLHIEDTFEYTKLKQW